MEDILTEEESDRWNQIKKDFNKNKLLGGAGENDPIARVVAQLTQFNDGLESIKDGITAAGTSYAQPQNLASETISQLESIITALRAVPVEVDINLIADRDDGIEDIEKTSKKKAKKAKKAPISIQPEVRQGNEA